MNRYLVISSDGHAGPPADHYRGYLEERYRPAFDEHQAALQAMREEMAKLRGTGDNSEFLEKWNAQTDGDGGLLAAYDSDYRTKVLDIEGVAAEVLFPDADVLGTGRIASSPFGSGLAGGAGNQPELALAGAKAHNRWLADFCRQSPDRRIGVALIPILYDHDAAVAEIEAAREMGLRGIMIPTRWFDQPAYHDPCYDRVWAAAQDNGMVLHTHSGSGPADYGEGRGTMAIYASEAYWWAARPLWVLLWAGVFERYPNLKYVVAENGAWWAPDLLYKMDEKWIGGHNTEKMGDVFRRELKMKPSDYFHRNCYLAAQHTWYRGHRSPARRRDRELPVGERPPPPGRHVPVHALLDPRAVARPARARGAAESWARTPPTSTGSIATRWQPIVAEIGPTVEEVHGDASIEPSPV